MTVNCLELVIFQIPKNMNQNKLVKNKKIKTNGTIDFINGQKNFLSKSIYI